MPNTAQATVQATGQAAPQPPSQPNNQTPLPTDFGTLVERYVALRDALKQAKEQHEAKCKNASEYLQRLTGAILDQLNKSGSQSVKTKAGTAYITTRRSASCEDAEEFQRHVIGTESWELADIKPNVTAVVDYANTNGHLPPGVKLSVMNTVNVRRS